MKRSLLLLSFLILPFIAMSEGQVKLKVVQFGIYTRTARRVVSDPAAPTGQVFLDGKAVLKKQTATIPAELGGHFGIGFSAAEDINEPIPLTVIYRFPAMIDPDTGKTITQFSANIKTIPTEPISYMLWDFTEPWELVSGEWIFQVYRGREKLIEQKFTVVSSTRISEEPESVP